MIVDNLIHVEGWTFGNDILRMDGYPKNYVRA